jgi:hypothetical protein
VSLVFWDVVKCCYPLVFEKSTGRERDGAEKRVSEEADKQQVSNVSTWNRSKVSSNIRSENEAAVEGNARAAGEADGASSCPKSLRVSELMQHQVEGTT